MQFLLSEIQNREPLHVINEVVWNICLARLFGFDSESLRCKLVFLRLIHKRKTIETIFLQYSFTTTQYYFYYTNIDVINNKPIRSSSRVYFNKALQPGNCSIKVVRQRRQTENIREAARTISVK